MIRFTLASLLLAGTALPAAAQDYESAEIIVTSSRRESDGYDASVPAIGLRRVADFAVQTVTITGDTRDQAKRREEIYAMIRGAIAQASKSGVELATGDDVVEPLTLANYRNLTLASDNRPDAERVSFLVKAKLNGSDAKAALDRIGGFVKATPAVGRALMTESGDLTLSVVGPEQYRSEIIGRIAQDALASAARFGPDYGVEARGVERPVEWTRASLTEILLYIPYTIAVVPKPR